MLMSDSKPHLPYKRKCDFLGIGKTYLHTVGMLTGFANKIRFARTQASLTQQQLADECGISREAVSQWESTNPANRTYPNTANLQIVSRLTGAPLAWLLNDGNVEPWRPPATLSSQRGSSPAGKPLTAEQQALLADYAACSPADRAEQLLPLASPRSRSALEYIIQAALDNRLTERDLELLQSIAVHITGRHPPGPIDAALKQRAKGRARTPR